MIRKLITPELDAQLQFVDGYIDRTKPLCENPVIASAIICGAFRSLDVSVSALTALSVRFAEEKYFVLCQSLERLECADLLELESDTDNRQLTKELNSVFPWIFTGDLVVCWGSSLRWWILFDAQLALGLMTTTKLEDATEARAAYSSEADIINVEEAFTECAAHEIRSLPEGLREQTGNTLFKSWGILNPTDKPPPTPDSPQQAPRY